MRENRLRTLLAADRTAVTAWMSIGSPYLAEVLSHCGYDAVTVDLQHGMFGLDSAITMLQGISAGPAIPMARCPSHDPAIIGKLLDAGAYGVICPGVDTPTQAAAFVRACHYPPSGARSFGPSRGLLYGGRDYVEHADATILTWAMIESSHALDNLEEIVATPGLDGVYVGPNDLALSLGETPGQALPPARVDDALARVAAAARAAGKWAGVFASDADGARRMVELGYHLVTPGNDVGVMRNAATKILKRTRGEAAARDEGWPAPSSGGGY